MLPQNHFAVAAVVTAVVALVLFPGMDWTIVALWVVVSGAVAAVIDLDVIVITKRAARTDPELVPWSDPMVATKDLKAFLVVLSRKGILSRVKWTHLGTGVVATLVAYFLVPSLLIPVAIGAWSHLATDVPYLMVIRRAAAGGVAGGP
jgi:hypothetical protein